MIRYLLFPWRPAPLLLVATFTAGLALALRLRWAGILPGFILVSWFFKYCFVLLDAAVAGEEEPPVLSVEMVNPFDEQRPLAQVLIIAAAGSLASFVRARLGLVAFAMGGALMIAALPASMAVLAVSGNPFRAASPLTLARLIRGMGRDYAWLLLATFACGTGIYELARSSAPLGATVALGELALLTVFALIGGAVHENRFALGLPTRTRAERRAEREAREHGAERGQMLDRSFGHLRLGRAADAWGEIERWIAAHCPDAAAHRPRANEEFPALIDSTSRWADPRIADRLASDYIGRLLSQRESGKALEVLEGRLASNPRYRPASPERATRLRELARLAGKRALQRALEPRADEPRATQPEPRAHEARAAEPEP